MQRYFNWIDNLSSFKQNYYQLNYKWRVILTTIITSKLRNLNLKYNRVKLKRRKNKRIRLKWSDEWININKCKLSGLRGTWVSNWWNVIHYSIYLFKK